MAANEGSKGHQKERGVVDKDGREGDGGGWVDVGCLYVLVVLAVFMEIVVEDESCKGFLLCCAAVKDLDTMEDQRKGVTRACHFLETRAQRARSAWSR